MPPAGRSSSRPGYSDRVFLNVPFDPRYQKLFDALVFTVHDCGFVARCARESEDSSVVRVGKLYDIIERCRYGVHDLSRTGLDSANRLPRFNMPLELGIFLGAKHFGRGRQRQKSCLILDRDRYRYQVFCSDIAGQDIRAHQNRVEDAITVVRNWLRSARGGGVLIPGGGRIAQRYVSFRIELPAMCQRAGLDHRGLDFLDYRTMVTGWLRANPW